MNKTELLKALEATVPTLEGKLHIERVLYKKEANKAYMSFLSDVLVGQQEFLLLERKLRELFPQLTVALRVASPSLGEDFLSDVNKYKSVLTDFLRRQSPALSAWIGDTGWSMQDGRILTSPLFRFRGTGERNGRILGTWEQTGRLAAREKLAMAGVECPWG